MKGRRAGALAAAVVMVLLAVAVGTWMWARRAEPRARDAAWWAQTGWRVNAVVAMGKPLVLTYNLWTAAESVPDTLNLEPIPAGSFEVVRSDLTHEVDVENGKTFQLCQFVISVRFPHSYRDERMGLLVNAGLWKRILPYGRVTCRVIRGSVDWLSVSFDSGEIQEPLVTRNNLVAVQLRNETQAPVRILGLWQAGNDGISAVRVVLPNSRSGARPINLPFALKPGETATLEYELIPRAGTVQGLVFQPALALASGRMHGFEVMPPVVIERSFVPWQTRPARGIVRFVEAASS
ncbi:hypothetical protein [Alicyclobacillus fructus]|uniref:hypothetical protein n=1 Tax=Alicyclobacillus fructus TaxID=2816082 RepID=UPI001A8EEDDE|nr:hypothetical protein [Alicyclobacillus fructus]